MTEQFLPRITIENLDDARLILKALKLASSLNVPKYMELIEEVRDEIKRLNSEAIFNAYVADNAETIFQDDTPEGN